jgi:hypothetical protein
MYYKKQVQTAFSFLDLIGCWRTASCSRFQSNFPISPNPEDDAEAWVGGPLETLKGPLKDTIMFVTMS